MIAKKSLFLTNKKKLNKQMKNKNYVDYLQQIQK